MKTLTQTISSIKEQSLNDYLKLLNEYLGNPQDKVDLTLSRSSDVIESIVLFYKKRIQNMYLVIAVSNSFAELTQKIINKYSTDYIYPVNKYLFNVYPVYNAREHEIQQLEDNSYTKLIEILEKGQFNENSKIIEELRNSLKRYEAKKLESQIDSEIKPLYHRLFIRLYPINRLIFTHSQERMKAIPTYMGQFTQVRYRKGNGQLQLQSLLLNTKEGNWYDPMRLLFDLLIKYGHEIQFTMYINIGEIGSRQIRHLYLLNSPQFSPETFINEAGAITLNFGLALDKNT